MLLDSTKTIGQRFKIIRTEKGFSQADVAEGICSTAVISQIECDRKYPSAHTLGKLADKMNVPLREIMGMKEKQMEAGFQIEMIRVYIAKGDYTHALELIDELDQRPDLLEHQHISLLTMRADSLIKNREYTRALEILLPFLQQQESYQTIDDEKLCDTYNKLGNAHYWANDMEKAYSAYEQGYRISLKLPEFGFVAARVTKNLGLTCHQLGLKKDSQLYLQKAHSFFERASDLNELANTLFYFALATGNGEHLIKARSLYESLNQTQEAITAKQHYAYYVEAKRDYRIALDEIESCTEEFEKIGNPLMCVYTLSRSVMICVENNCLDKAEQYLKLAEDYKSQLSEEDSLQIADFYKAKAIYLMALRKYEEAIANAMKSTEICAKIGLNMHSIESLMVVAEAYHQQGLNEDAYIVSKKINKMLRKPLRGE